MQFPYKILYYLERINLVLSNHYTVEIFILLILYMEFHPFFINYLIRNLEIINQNG